VAKNIVPLLVPKSPWPMFGEKLGDDVVDHVRHL